MEPEPTELVQKIDSIFSRKKRAYEEAFKKRFPRDQRYVNQQEILSFVPKPASLRSDISPGPKKCPFVFENYLSTLEFQVRSLITLQMFTYRDLRGSHRFSLQYLWKWAVRITEKSYTPQRERFVHCKYI